MTNKKKLLILNGSHSEIPLIVAGKKLGFHVITTGNDPSLIGHQYADEYHHADYSDQETILTLANQLKIDAICSCANDFGAITAAYVAEKMNLPGHDSYNTTILLHQKDTFKKFSTTHNLPTPNADCYDNIEMALAAVEFATFPRIIKPVDLTGGKGVSTVNNKMEYILAVKNAFKLSCGKRIVIEEYFLGSQHSLSAFLVNQKVVFYFSDNEYSYLNPYYVSTSAAPAMDIEKYSAKLIAAIETIAKALNLSDGVFHIQYLADGAEAKIIDITRRCSGDMYAYPVDKSTGINWASWIVKAETGMDCSDFPSVTQHGYCGRHCVMSAQNGKINQVILSDSLREVIYDQIFWWNVGDVIKDHLTQKVGIVFLQYASMTEMLSISKRLPELIRVEIAQ